MSMESSGFDTVIRYACVPLFGAVMNKLGGVKW